LEQDDDTDADMLDFAESRMNFTGQRGHAAPGGLPARRGGRKASM
jgi:hypothetical protein